MVVFDGVADDYQAARPSYPAALYDLIDSLTGGMTGKLVADVGAGTGLASRQLLERQAHVIAVDAGIGMLELARRHMVDLPGVAADGSSLPLRAAEFDMVCFAQSWHWVDQRSGAAEAARVLKPAGWWAAWWNHPWADGDEWFK